MAKDKSMKKAGRAVSKKVEQASRKASAKASKQADKASAKNDSSKVWSVFSLVAALGAASVAKKVLNTSWRATTGKTPPENPADPDVQIAEAVMWAVASGTFVALARMLAQRKAAGYYQKSTGRLPPGLQKDED